MNAKEQIIKVQNPYSGLLEIHLDQEVLTFNDGGSRWELIQSMLAEEAANSIKFNREIYPKFSYTDEMGNRMHPVFKVTGRDEGDKLVAYVELPDRNISEQLYQDQYDKVANSDPTLSK